MPLAVLAAPRKRAVPPALAVSMACLACAFPAPAHRSGPGQPFSAPKSSTCMTRLPPSLMNCRRPSRSNILMQSPQPARTLRRTSGLSASPSPAAISSLFIDATVDAGSGVGRIGTPAAIKSDDGHNHRDLTAHRMLGSKVVAQAHPALGGCSRQLLGQTVLAQPQRD